MKVAKSLDDLMKKPRHGVVFRTSQFILHDPKAFRMLFQWGLWFAVALFGFSSFACLMAKADVVLTVLFCVFFILSAYKLFQFYRIKSEVMVLTEGMTVWDFMQYGKKKEIKTSKVK